MKLTLESEPFGRLGNVSARGFSNQLGRPDLDALSVLVREAVQNSWDAKLKRGNVKFDVTGWQLDSGQREAFAELFATRPKEDPGLGDLIRSGDPITLVALSDRGTVGLNGPTNADEVEEDGHSNFVDFLRNAGRKPELAGTGGTYGYGKAAFFGASAVSTIMAYTRIRTPRGLPTRLMAASWGEEFTVVRGGRRERFTGRHWWGVPSDASRSAVDPLVGQVADSVSRQVGIPAFVEDQTGTTVVVVAPTFAEFSDEEILRALGRTFLLSFWPRMLKARGGQSIEFSFRWNGVEGAMPSPVSSMPIDQYAVALRAVEEFIETGKSDSAEVSVIESQRPAKLIGHLALKRFVSHPRGRWVAQQDEDDTLPAPLAVPSHHVALMRRPRQVVKYLEGPVLATAAFEYCGVFLANQGDDEVESAFSEAEPPTHDDWVGRGLKNSAHKAIVNVAKREIKARLKAFVGGDSAGGAIEGRTPLGFLSYALKGLVPGLPGTGSEEQSGATAPRPGGAGGPGGARTARPSADITQLRYERSGGALVAILDIAVTARRGSRILLTATPTVKIDDGGSSEADPPTGAATPRVLYWTSEDGTRTSGIASIEVDGSAGQTWTLAVSVPPDAMIGVAVDADYVE